MLGPQKSLWPFVGASVEPEKGSEEKLEDTLSTLTQHLVLKNISALTSFPPAPSKST